jgi:hypothetical protein
MPSLPDLTDPLRIVTSAVSPVVMVSATAILISGVNSRYISISDRVRNLAREYRRDDPTAQRRQNIRQQMKIFQRRLHLVSWATRVLYAAAGCFVSVAVLISISAWTRGMGTATLPIFLIGLSLTMLAIVFQVLELQASNATIDLETADILNDVREK